MRKAHLETGHYYHVYNRGVDKRMIFTDQEDYNRFLTLLSEFNNDLPIGGLTYHNLPVYKKRLELRDQVSELVEIIAYCINDNHYHLMLRQKTDSGISQFIKRVAGGYTMYFNKKHQRSGTLFQGPFKAKLIDTDSYLDHLSVYINLNNKIHNKSLASDLYSSWRHYTQEGYSNPLCVGQEIITDNYASKQDYRRHALRVLPDIMRRKNEDRGLENALID